MVDREGVRWSMLYVHDDDAALSGLVPMLRPAGGARLIFGPAIVVAWRLAVHRAFSSVVIL